MTTTYPSSGYRNKPRARDGGFQGRRSVPAQRHTPFAQTHGRLPGIPTKSGGARALSTALKIGKHAFRRFPLGFAIQQGLEYWWWSHNPATFKLGSEWMLRKQCTSKSSTHAAISHYNTCGTPPGSTTPCLVDVSCSGCVTTIPFDIEKITLMRHTNTIGGVPRYTYDSYWWREKWNCVGSDPFVYDDLPATRNRPVVAPYPKFWPNDPGPETAPQPWPEIQIPAAPAHPNPTYAPSPQRSPTERTTRGYSPPGTVGPTRGRIDLPSAPGPNLEAWPGGKLRPAPPTFRFRVPDRGTKEKKLRAPTLRELPGGPLLEGLLEGVDLVDALHDALPREFQCTRTRGQKCLPQDRARAVYDHFEEIDVADAFENIIANEIEDRIFGEIGKAAGKSAANNPFGPLTGPQFGPAL